MDRLEEFVRQEEAFGAELVKGSDFERALVLLITQLRNTDHSALTFGTKRSVGSERCATCRLSSRLATERR